MSSPPQRRFDLHNYPDWEDIHKEMMYAVRDSYFRTQKLSGGRTTKALCGLYAGSPVIPPYIVDRDKSSPTLDRYVIYEPHRAVISEICRELVMQGGSKLKTAQALRARYVEFPLFPPEYQYMETRTSLRRCPRSSTGYMITPHLIGSLIPNPRLLGWWVWNGQVTGYQNHEPAIDEDLFLAANKALAEGHKPRGRGFHSRPLPFTGLLHCGNHDIERRISGHGAEGRYTEDRDYQKGVSEICFDINHRFIDEPLLDYILSKCSFDVYADEVLAELEAERASAKAKSRKAKQDRERILREIGTLEQNLDQALASTIDQSRIGRIERLIGERRAELDQLEASGPPTGQTILSEADIARIRAFLANIRKGWYRQTPELQNGFLRIILEKVVLKHSGRSIQATIHWRTGLQHQILIERPPAGSRRENRWTQCEDDVLRRRYPSSPPDVLLADLPNRTWISITCRAVRLGLKRERTYHPPRNWRPWTEDEDQALRGLYEAGIAIHEVSARLNRTADAIEVRASQRKLTRPRVARWSKAEARWTENPYNFIDNNELCRGR